jgi:hypothetical protein|uniref:Uncharacterized protein n=1 Tax=Populus trichocarpa TaxID=3694 RepID=B9HZ59_POPTR
MMSLLFRNFLPGNKTFLHETCHRNCFYTTELIGILPHNIFPYAPIDLNIYSKENLGEESTALLEKE